MTPGLGAALGAAAEAGGGVGAGVPATVTGPAGARSLSSLAGAGFGVAFGFGCRFVSRFVATRRVGRRRSRSEVAELPAVPRRGVASVVAGARAVGELASSAGFAEPAWVGFDAGWGDGFGADRQADTSSTHAKATSR